MHRPARNCPAADFAASTKTHNASLWTIPHRDSASLVPVCDSVSSNLDAFVVRPDAGEKGIVADDSRPLSDPQYLALGGQIPAPSQPEGREAGWQGALRYTSFFMYGHGSHLSNW